MSWRRALSWLLTVAIILPILTACKDDGDPLLAKELKTISKNVSAESSADAQKVLELQKSVQQTIRDNPTLAALPGENRQLSADKALKLHEGNAKETLRVIDAQAEALKKLADNVKALSSIKYQKGVKAERIAESETLTLMNLLMVRDLAQAASRRILFLMVKFDKPYFDQLEQNEAMKQRLLSEYTTALAVSAVSANDLRTTLTGLREMREANLIKSELLASIDKVVGQFGGTEKAKREEVSQFLQESITDKAQDTLSQAMTDYHNQLKGKSFLFDPAHPDHPLVHVLVIVSNLSWGLINTLVGLGFVITAAIVAPITMVAGATMRAFGYEPLFYEMRMPRLRIAENNMQIYADVCGLGYLPSKMSAGLFELDFCTGESFASDHEGGHAKQSALLGPLYFPAAILSYILNMGHGGFIEDWADAWAVA